MSIRSRPQVDWAYAAPGAPFCDVRQHLDGRRPHLYDAVPYVCGYGVPQQPHQAIPDDMRQGIRRVKVLQIMKEMYRSKLEWYDRINGIACGAVS